MADTGSSGLPLDQYTKTCPPGWRLGLYQYPLKRYLDLLKLWYRLTDYEPSQQGPAVAGRLQGRPFTLATELRLTKQDGTILVGDAALAHPGEEATAERAATPSGLQRLIAVLREKYGTETQDQVTQDIDDFLDLRRTRHTLLEYLIEFEHRYDHAAASSGLNVNDVCKTHMLLKHCMVDATTKNHIRLLINNDLDKYDEVFQHLMRMAKTAAAPAVSSDRTYAGIGYDKEGYEYVDPDVPWAEDDDWWNDPKSWFGNLEYDLWDYDEEEWDRHRGLHNDVSARRVVDNIEDMNDQPGTYYCL